MEGNIYQAVATRHDPRSDQGMQEHSVQDRANLTRERAVELVLKWSRQGYWGVVYNQRTAECVVDYPPKGGSQ